MALRNWRRSRGVDGVVPSAATRSNLGEPLASEERLLETIEVLTDVNRRQPDPKVEELLVGLRLDAFAPRAPSPVPALVPAETADPFESGATPPEVSAANLTPQLLRRGILGHGCLLVRGLIDPSTVGHLVDDIDQVFAGYDAYIDGAPVAQTTPWYVPFSAYPDPVTRQWARAGGGVLAVDSPRGLFNVIEAFEELGIGELATGFLGERPALLSKKCTLRRIPAGQTQPAEPDGSKSVGWHQDGAFMGQDIRSLDVWIALSDCGDNTDSPGLDIVARRLDHLVETGTEGTRFDWSVASGVAQRAAQGSIVTPTFAPGDALIFDHLLLHRTGLRDGMTTDRYAIEAWFAAPSSYPPDQLPIAY